MIPDNSWDILAKEIHQVNVSKGFWGDNPNERNIGQALNLIHDEISEAVAVRYSVSADAKVPAIDEFSAEISDIAIRTLDLCGFFGAVVDYPRSAHNIVFEQGVDTNLLMLGTAVSNVSEAHRKGDSIKIELENLFSAILSFSDIHAVNLWECCELKLAYNKTRPFLHGKKY